MEKCGARTLEEFRAVPAETLFKVWQENRKAMRGGVCAPCIDGELVIFERIDRIVGRSDECDVALANDVANTDALVLKLCFTDLPNLTCGVCVKYTIVSEVVLELEMAPMIHRIADSLRQECREFDKFLIRISVPGDVVFIHTVRAHQAPLIMVAREPELCDV